MSTYTDVLNQLNTHAFTGTTFKPRMLWNTKSYSAVDTDFLNAFRTLVTNGVIQVVTGDALSDWNISYELSPKKQPLPAPNTTDYGIKFDIDELTKFIGSHGRLDNISSVPPKTKEQVYKNEILKSLNVIANTIGDIYARVEKMETPNDVDLSKISKQDLLDELMKRMS